MAINFHNKIVFITGASSGIGKATAELFANAGAKLILAARRQDKLEALTRALSAITAVYPLILDVQQESAVKTAIASLPPEWQAIDILINNAGLAQGLDSIAAGQSADWDRMIDTNIKGLLYVTQAVLPRMLSRQEGHIINIGSIAGRAVYAGGAVYCATKHAVRGLTAALKMECHGTPLRVTEIAPGAVETEFSLVRYHGNHEKADKTYEGMTPLTGLDIAESIFFVASRPPHVNVSEMVIFPTDQSAITMIHRRTLSLVKKELVEKGLEDARMGRLESKGSFSQFTEEE